MSGMSGRYGKHEGSQRWAALDKQNERVVDASPAARRARRDRPDLDRVLPAAS